MLFLMFLDRMEQLYNIIKEKIKENNGAICFKEFMGICLYDPEYGYYYRSDGIIGKRGDYFTSVSVGSLFGELLVCEFLRWYHNARNAWKADYLHLIEAGAYKGELASDILYFLVSNSEHAYHNHFKYIFVEPSNRMRLAQRNILRDHRESIIWVRDFDTFHEDAPEEAAKLGNSYQVIFSNELLDAFPIHRLLWLQSENKWMELGVTIEGDNFKWTIIKPCDECNEIIENLNSQYSKILVKFKSDFILEYPSEALKWWRKACKFLKRGRIVAIDYGFAGYGLINPGKPKGTVRSYRKHHISDSVFENIGEQDITADVNFDFFIQEAEALGLKKVFYGSQQVFLTEIVKENNIGTETKWFFQKVRQFKTLTHPDQLGLVMKVLVMEKE